MKKPDFVTTTGPLCARGPPGAWRGVGWGVARADVKVWGERGANVRVALSTDKSLVMPGRLGGGAAGQWVHRGAGSVPVWHDALRGFGGVLMDLMVPISAVAGGVAGGCAPGRCPPLTALSLPQGAGFRWASPSQSPEEHR